MTTEARATEKGTGISSETRFCPQCGHATAGADRFCRGCGTALAETEALPGPEPTAPANPSVPADGPSNGTPLAFSGPEPRGLGRRALVGIGLAALALAAGAGVLVAGGVVSLGGDPGPTTAETRVVESEMVERDEFFKAERTYLAAFGGALTELRRYQREQREFEAENKRIEEEFADEFDACFRYYEVACPEPAYPDPPKAPNFSAETKEIRAAGQDFEELRVALNSSSPRGGAGRLHAQLIAAVEAVKLEAEHNADVFDEAIEPAKDEAPGGVDNGKIKTLRKGTALPSIRQMNRTAVRALRAVGLSLARFDVPGGRDLDAKDHSDEI